MRCAELGNAGICFSLVGQTIAFCRLSTPGRFRCPTDHKKRWSVPPRTAAAYLGQADSPHALIPALSGHYALGFLCAYLCALCDSALNTHSCLVPASAMGRFDTAAEKFPKLAFTQRVWKGEPVDRRSALTAR